MIAGIYSVSVYCIRRQIISPASFKFRTEPAGSAVTGQPARSDAA